MSASTAIKLELIQRANFVTDSPNAIKQRIRDLMESGEIRLRDIEEKTSFKSSTWSQFFNDKYEGDVEKLNQVLSNFYLQWISKHTMIETVQAENIHAFLELAWKRRRMAFIIGPNGRGKTKALNYYVANHKHHEYIAVVEVSAIFTQMELLNKIGEALRITHAMNGSLNDRLQAIIRAIQRKEKEKPVLLLVDQADEIKPRAIKLLRDIHGDEQARCSIVIVATPQFHKILRDPQLSYMRRRFRMKLEVSDISFEEAKEIASMWPHNLKDAELKSHWNWALSDYGVDSLIKLFDLAYDFMVMRNKQKIDSDCIKEAQGYL